MGGAFRIVNYKNDKGERNKEDNERVLFGGIHQIGGLSENVKQKFFPYVLVTFTFLLFCNLQGIIPTMIFNNCYIILFTARFLFIIKTIFK